MKRNIFLSKPGLICCAGQNPDELYESCLNGNRGGFVSKNGYPIGLVPESVLPQVKACEPAPGSVEPFVRRAEVPLCIGNTKIFRIIDAALEQIRPEIEKAITKYGREKIGVCLGSCDNGSESSLAAHKEFFEKGSFPKNYNLRYQSASYPADYISEKFGLTGPVFTISTACASSASAIVKGAELIRSGLCSAVIAGGADLVSDIVFTGFNSLGAVSDELCNPFSKNRKGINLGEGAAFFLLDFAATPSGIELLGAGESADAFHITAPGEDGAGPAKAMKAALLDAEIKPEQIGYANLHGTATPLNDKAESLAMTTVFNPVPPSSSTKPITGHTLGAAGAIEAAVCWMIINERKGLPVHCWDGVYDDEFPSLPLVSSTEPFNGKGSPLDVRERTPSICMSNSYAFGGCNVSLILGKRTYD